MLDYKKDLKMTDLILQDNEVKDYDKLYFTSNENLNEVFYGMDFTGKNVLTVLASGDQAFHIYNHNAKHVDLFDINKLTIYFFYLRIWFIEQYNMFHLPNHIENTYILNLLNLVTPRTMEEKFAHNYWLVLIDILLSNHKSLNSIQIEYPKDLAEIKDLDRIKEQLKNRNFNFYNIDISKNNFSIKEKYDVIYLSNIIDWILINHIELNTLVSNLNNLLTDTGTIICTDYLLVGASHHEDKAFQKLFNKKDLPITKEESYRDSYPPGYCYVKRKNNNTK